MMQTAEIYKCPNGIIVNIPNDDSDIIQDIEHCGDFVTVILNENGSTGYCWTVPENVADRNFPKPYTHPQSVGATYNRVVKFSLPSEEQVLNMFLSRPWLPDDEVIRTIRLRMIKKH